MKFKGSDIEKLKELIATPTEVVSITHRTPDGDALGSSLAWKSYLEKKGHKVTFISPTLVTDNLKWIPGTDKVMICENGRNKKNCDGVIGSAKVIFCLDFNAITRLEGLGAAISASPAYKIMIDHHRQPEDFANL